MRAIVKQNDGSFTFNFMWMPSFIGHNRKLKELMDEELGPKLVGKDLDMSHNMILDWLQGNFPHLVGLRKYLSGLDYVEDGNAEAEADTAAH